MQVKTMGKKLSCHLNLVQLLYLPIFALGLIVFLANWLRDLIVLEWDITPQFASILGLIIMAIIVFMTGLIIYCIVKLYWVLTEVLRISKDDPVVKELIDELNKIKKKE